MKIVVLQRGSLSSKHFVVSRSVFNRVLEPINYMHEKLFPEAKLTIATVEEVLLSGDCQYDVAIFCKHNTEESVELMDRFRQQGVVVIHDFDDLIYKFTEDSLAYEHMSKVEYIGKHLVGADHVVFSNQSLQKITCSDFDIASSNVIKTGINTDLYYNNSYAPQHNSVMFTNGDNIKVEAFREGFSSVFNDFLSGYPDVGFDVFGDTESYLEGFQRYNFLGSLPWDEHKKYLMENQYKFGIVPLGAEEESPVHQEFSICKTPIKYYEYGALRIPAIYSDAHIYRDVVSDRETGLLVGNDLESWGAALDELNGDFLLRKTIADNSFEDVVGKHHIKIAAQSWFELIQELTS